MGMSLGGPGNQKADINITPMIDVLLVLIIIFMVITPLASTGLGTQVPQPAPPDQEETARPRDIVVTVEKDGSVEINGEHMDIGGLPDRLRRIFQARGDDVIFVRGDKELEFEQVAQVVDIAKGSGMTRVALMTR